jgi:hypothetical protein
MRMPSCRKAEADLRRDKDMLPLGVTEPVRQRKLIGGGGELGADGLVVCSRAPHPPTTKSLVAPAAQVTAVTEPARLSRYHDPPAILVNDNVCFYFCYVMLSLNYRCVFGRVNYLATVIPIAVARSI